VVEHEKGFICDCDIDPVGKNDIPVAEYLEDYFEAGRKALGKTVYITLNGGLGTSMGLKGPKSLIEVKNGRTFLDFKLEGAKRRGVELVLMNSFNTHEKTMEALEKKAAGLRFKVPRTFLQSRFPKILRHNLAPAVWAENPSLEWNPPGHGEIYSALQGSGMLRKLVEEGKRYAFVSNSDNLGACVDESILGYFVEKGFPFMMEVTQRRPMDAKGGHLAYMKNGGLLLREIAQCPEEELRAFQDIEKYRFFNTKNLWIDLVFLEKFLKENRIVRLPMILKPGKLDPRNAGSPDIYQVETAMGAAVSLFEGAAAVNVSKSRFIPVKGHNDLLAICSDCYIVTDKCELAVNPGREETPPIKVSLDPAFYKKFDMFFERFRQGVPSLVDCESLTIEGDVYFEEHVQIEGRVRIANRSGKPAVVEKNTVIDRDLAF
jgi:UTP--glucose-1-phosphate uridylyltransferase